MDEKLLRSLSEDCPRGLAGYVGYALRVSVGLTSSVGCVLCADAYALYVPGPGSSDKPDTPSGVSPPKKRNSFKDALRKRTLPFRFMVRT